MFMILITKSVNHHHQNICLFTTYSFYCVTKSSTFYFLSYSQPSLNLIKEESAFYFNVENFEFRRHLMEKIWIYSKI